MKAVFDKRYVKRIDGPNVKTTGSLADKAEALMDDMATFKRANGCDRLVVIWCGSTEVHHKPAKVHQTLAAFEKGLAKNDPDIAPSQIYAYAALKSGVPFANGAPNLAVDAPVLRQLATDRNIANPPAKRLLLYNLKTKRGSTLGEFPMQNVVPKLSSTPGSVRWVGPELGQHTVEVLKEVLGMSSTEIEALQSKGVV